MVHAFIAIPVVKNMWCLVPVVKNMRYLVQYEMPVCAVVLQSQTWLQLGMCVVTCMMS